MRHPRASLHLFRCRLPIHCRPPKFIRNGGWSGRHYTYSTTNKVNHIAMLSGERWTSRKREKGTCNSKPECKQQKQRRSSSAKKQNKTAFELEIKDVTIEVCRRTPRFAD